MDLSKFYNFFVVKILQRYLFNISTSIQIELAIFIFCFLVLCIIRLVSNFSIKIFKEGEKQCNNATGTKHLASEEIPTCFKFKIRKGLVYNVKGPLLEQSFLPRNLGLKPKQLSCQSPNYSIFHANRRIILYSMPISHEKSDRHILLTVTLAIENAKLNRFLY